MSSALAASTLLSGANPTSFVFADSVYLTPSAQRQFGTYAYDRLRARWTAADWSDLPGFALDRALEAWPALRASCTRPPVGWSELNSFNGYLRVSIDPQRFDGRNFGLVFADEAVQAINANSAGYTTYLVSPYNITDAACGSTPLLTCSNAIDTTTNLNTGGLVTGALYNTHLWASDRWLGYPAHYLLGLTAQNRLSVLPF